MYCNKCGKEIPDNEKFCVYCGAKIDVQPQMNASPSNNISNVSAAPAGFALNSVTDIISAILVIILSIAYLVVAIKDASEMGLALKFIGGGARVFGYILYWGIFIWVLCDSLQLIFTKSPRKKFAPLISLFVITIVIWIGGMIWDGRTFEAIPLVLCGVFQTYGALTVLSFILLILTLVCLIASPKTNN